MKYALFVPADQTIIYLTWNDCWTTKHSEVVLFDSLQIVEKKIEIMSALEGKKLFACISSNESKPPDGLSWDDAIFVEEVADEVEFRQRKDTW